MTVVTCYVPMGTALQQSKYLELIRFWKGAWSQAGFNPVAVDVSKSTGYFPAQQALEAAFARTVTVNHRDYEWHCYFRWLVLRKIAERFEGPILMVDGDTFPNPKAAKHPFWADPRAFWHEPFQILDRYGNPCAVLADAKGVSDWLDVLVEQMPRTAIVYKGQLHTSDMIVAQQHMPKAEEPLCENFTAQSQTPLVHVSTDVVLTTGLRAEDKLAFCRVRVGTMKHPAKQ